MPPVTHSPMTLTDRIETAMRDAMRTRDARRTQTLRMVMAAAQNRRIELGRPLTDDEAAEVLGRQAKQRRESIEQFRAGGRSDLAAIEETELGILTEFLPEQLTEEQVADLVREAIAETGAAGPADMGRVMGRVMPATRGRADGRLVSDVTRRLLSEPKG
jgi:uncharacterized protein